MKIWKVFLVALALAAAITGLVGCTGASTPTADSSVATVSRGNVSVDITAAGNLALAQTQDLPVNLFYQGGTVGRGGTIGQVLVKVGDTVKKGQVLVSVDPTEWADQLQTVQNNVTTAQRGVTDKSSSVTDAERNLTDLQRAVTTAETAVTKAEQTVSEKQLGVQQAQLNIQSAQDDLNSIAEVKQIQDAIDGDQDQIDLINLIIKGVMVGGFHIGADISYLNLQKSNAQAALAEDKQNLADLLNGTDVNVSQYIETQVAQANLKVAQMNAALVDAQTALSDAQTAVDNAQLAVEDANYAVTKGQLAVNDAKLDLDNANSNLANAQKKLSDAKAMSPDIAAPFDGFVTAVNVKAGDNVYNGTIVATIADTNKFEADILVSEMDIAQVEVGGRATIQAGAISGRVFPATVTSISPTATIQSGVVNYQVKVELENATANVTSPSAPPASTNATTPAASDNTTVTLPAPLQQAVASGRMTQQQAEAIAQQMQNGGGFSPA